MNLVAKHESSCDGWHFTSVLNALQCGASARAESGAKPAREPAEEDSQG